MNSRNRIGWIVGCLAALLIVAGICCVTTVLTGGGVVAFLAPAVRATGTALAQEMAPQPRVTDLAPALPPPPGPTPTPPAATNFTNNEGRSEQPAVVSDNEGNLHIVWFDDSLRAPNSGEGDILHRQRSAGGEWSDVENLTEGFEMVMESSLRLLAAPDGRLCALWSGSQSLTIGANAYLRCQAGGQWAPPEKLDDTDSAFDCSPAFAPDGGLEVACSSFGEWRLRDRQLVPPSNDYVYTLKLLIDSHGGYHVLWIQGEPNALWHRYSTDKGETWGETTQVSGEGQFYTSGAIQAICDSRDSLHVAWSDPDGAHYRQWQTDGGWQASEKFLAPNEYMGEVGMAADAQGLVQVTFTMIIHGPPSLGYVQRQADGKWTSPMLIASMAQDETLGSGGPVMAVDTQGRRHFVWPVYRFGNGPGSSDLYHAVLP
ncbi:MAG: hypothetical protein ACOYYS_15370 [Chloroflexota bacterium]